MDILIIILVVGCLTMTVWVLILDTRIEQLQGYVKRLERDLSGRRHE